MLEPGHSEPKCYLYPLRFAVSLDPFGDLMKTPGGVVGVPKELHLWGTFKP